MCKDRSLKIEQIDENTLEIIVEHDLDIAPKEDVEEFKRYLWYKYLKGLNVPKNG